MDSVFHAAHVLPIYILLFVYLTNLSIVLIAQNRMTECYVIYCLPVPDYIKPSVQCYDELILVSVRTLCMLHISFVVCNLYVVLRYCCYSIEV